MIGKNFIRIKNGARADEHSNGHGPFKPMSGFSGNFNPLNLPAGRLFVDRSYSPMIIFDVVLSHSTSNNVINTLKLTPEIFDTIYKSEVKRISAQNKELSRADVKQLAQESTKNIIAERYIAMTFDVGSPTDPFVEYRDEQKEAFIGAITKSPVENALKYLSEELKIEQNSPEYEELKIIMSEKIEDPTQLRDLIKPFVKQNVSDNYVPTTQMKSMQNAEKQELTEKQLNSRTNYIVSKSGNNVSVMDEVVKELKVMQKAKDSTPTK